MTVTEFLSKENISKSNPFENLNVLQEITMEQYRLIVDRVVDFTFTEANEYLPLTKEFSFRLWVMVEYLGLDISDMPEVNDLFTVLICSDIYDKFISLLNYPAQIDTIRTSVSEYTQYLISNNVLFKDLVESGRKVFNILSNETMFKSVMQNVGVDIFDNIVASENIESDDLSGGGVNG